MHGLGWLLFSFRGVIKRSEFLAAIVISSILLVGFAWLFNYVNIKYLMPIIFKIDTASLDLSGFSAQDQQVLTSLNQLRKFSGALIALLIPYIFHLLASYWILFAIYIKRYRSIGCPTIVTILVIALTQIFPLIVGSLLIMPDTYLAIGFKELYTSTSFIMNVIIFYGLVFIMLAVYLFIPLLWPSRVEYN